MFEERTSLHKVKTVQDFVHDIKKCSGKQGQGHWSHDFKYISENGLEILTAIGVRKPSELYMSST